MKKINVCILLSCCLFLTSCFFRPHKMDIEQGNIITEKQVSTLHRGMTSEQVKKLMGNPILVNIFSANRLEYVYTFQAGYENMQVKRVSCIFQGNVLREVLVS